MKLSDFIKGLEEFREGACLDYLHRIRCRVDGHLMCPLNRSAYARDGLYRMDVTAWDTGRQVLRLSGRVCSSVMGAADLHSGFLTETEHRREIRRRMLVALALPPEGNHVRAEEGAVGCYV